jgi:purine-binding chemotaxis protein CheW
MNELYVVFNIDTAEYALPAAAVLQLESYQGATPVPGTAAHVAGIIQVRGRVIPVLSLRSLFGYPALEPTIDTRVIVTDLGGRQVGLLVDKSREVVRIADSAVQGALGLVETSSRGFFTGVAQLEQRLLILLDLRKVVGEEHLHEQLAQRLDTLPGAAALPEREPGALPGVDSNAAPGD